MVPAAYTPLNPVLMVLRSCALTRLWRNFKKMLVIGSGGLLWAKKRSEILPSEISFYISARLTLNMCHE